MNKSILEFIDNNKWKTSRDKSHQYTLSYQKSPNRKTFEYFVLHIRDKGYKAEFCRHFYKYLNIGEYKYWTMGNPLEETILINRCKIDLQ